MLSGHNKPNFLRFFSAIPDVPVDVFIVLSSFSDLAAQSPHFANFFVYYANYTRDTCKNIFLIVAVDVELVFLFYLLYLIKK